MAYSDLPLEDSGEWLKVLGQETREGGAFQGLLEPLTPAIVLNELKRSRSNEEKLQQELSSLKQRLASTVSQSCALTRDDIALKKDLAVARAASEPSVLQLRQLLLDPAVNREFARLKAELEARTREAAATQEELRAVHMAMQDPKAVHMLAMNTKKLEEKVLMLTQERAEGKIAQLERSLALARDQLEDMRKQYGELEDHTHSLDDEIEALQREALTLRRAVERAQEIATAATTTTTTLPPTGGGGYHSSHHPSSSHPYQQSYHHPSQHPSQQYPGGGGRFGGPGRGGGGGGRFGGRFMNMSVGRFDGSGGRGFSGSGGPPSMMMNKRPREY